MSIVNSAVLFFLISAVEMLNCLLPAILRSLARSPGILNWKKVPLLKSLVAENLTGTVAPLKSSSLFLLNNASWIVPMSNPGRIVGLPIPSVGFFSVRTFAIAPVPLPQASTILMNGSSL